MMDNAITRKCTKCKIVKTLENFSYEKLGKYKKRASCRLCDNEYRREKRMKDPTSSRKAVAKWQASHKEQKKESKRSWRHNNRKKANAIALRWINKNKARVASYAENRRAEKFNTQNRISVKEWADILFFYGYRCLACGTTEKITMDHVIPLIKGGEHSAKNVQPLCKSCNSKKHDKIIDYR